MKTRVGLLFGGVSPEHAISLRSARCVYEAFDAAPYTVVPIGISKTGVWRHFTRDGFLEVCEEGVFETPPEEPAKTCLALLDEIDIVFPLIHGAIGEDGALQGALTLLNIPYVGPNILASSLCMDKDISKRVASSAGLSVAAYAVLHDWEVYNPAATAHLAFPRFIKPARAGSSIGITRVEEEVDMEAALDSAFTYDEKVVIEQGVPGIEVEVAVLGGIEVEASLPGRIIPSHAYYSFENKWDHTGAAFELPVNLSPDVQQRVREVAIHAYKVLQCEGMARVDMFVTPDHTVYLNEVNTIPGFTAGSLYPLLWKLSGKSYGELLSDLIEEGLSRHKRQSRYTGMLPKSVSSLETREL